MLGVSLNGTSPHIKALVASTELLNREAPFSSRNRVYFLSPGTPTIYGVDRQTESQIQVNNGGNVGVNSSGQAKYLRLKADGSATTWTSTNYPALNNAHDDAGALTNANRLRTVLVVNGLPKVRVQSDATPTASQWKVAWSGGVATLTAKSAANGAYAAGTILEVYMYDAADIVTQGPLVAGTMTEGTSYDFMVATAAAAMFAERV